MKFTLGVIAGVFALLALQFGLAWNEQRIEREIEQVQLGHPLQPIDYLCISQGITDNMTAPKCAPARKEK